MPFSPTSDRPVLLTGTSGFVGGYLLSALRKQGISSKSIVTLSLSGAHSNAEIRNFMADITDKKAVDEVIASVKPAAIIHLAAIAEPAKARGDPGLAWRVNFEGTRHLANAVLRHVPDARFVFAGSSESYGASFNDVDGPISEASPLRPMSAYGATKAACDIMLGQMAYEGLDVVRFRAFNHTGPGQTPAYVVPAFAQQIAKIEAGQQEPVLSVGNLDAARDFLDVRDVVMAYVAAMTNETAGGMALNLCSAKARKVQAILGQLLEMSDCEIEIVADKSRQRPSEVLVAVGDNTNVQSQLGWSAQFSFDTTLLAVLDMERAKINAGI